LLAVGVATFTALIPLVQTLPLSIQRSLSVLPLPVNPAARADAKGSTEWRIKMWQALAPEIPQYFWLGKGFAASATDYYLAQESVRRGLSRDYETMILSGDYHNGPLSVIIPFGIWGALAFLAFIISALRVLYLNHRNGDPALARVNTFLFSYFIAKLIFFLTIFGALHIDIATFAGIVGLSISINGGASRKKCLATETLKTSDELNSFNPRPVPVFQR
jgi:O-antigen ligase